MAAPMAWPTQPLDIHALADAPAVRRVSLLGSDEILAWSHGAAGLTIQPPTEQPCKHVFVFKIE